VEEGRQIELGTATERSNKVVRLPRDWLGPREDLIPFSESASHRCEPDTFVPNDFWGERAAAIHSVIQPPAPEPPADAPAGEPPAPAPRSRLLRLAAAAVVVLAASGAVPLLFGGSPTHVTGGERLNIAALVSNGVSRITNIGLPRLVSRATTARTVKHVIDRAPHPKTMPSRARRHSLPDSVSSYVAHASVASARPAYHATGTSPAPRVDTSAPSGRRSIPSSVAVSPTGQSGALGPVSSPDG
jgi:hypothetical protein